MNCNNQKNSMILLVSLSSYPRCPEIGKWSMDISTNAKFKFSKRTCALL